MRVATALLFSTLGLACLAYSPAAAAQSQYAWARVIDAQPIYDEIERPGQTRRHCTERPLAGNYGHDDGSYDGYDRYQDDGYDYDDRHAYRDPYVQPRRSDAGVVFGAILGGVIGNQFGSGNGRVAATVAGAALGSAIASDSQRQRHYDDRYGYRDEYRRPSAFGYADGAVEQVCETTREYHREQQVTGFEVTWEYDGQVGYSRTRNHPGEQIQVEVQVRAIED